ncbi:MAG: putative hydrolase of the superfamily [Chloroflexota bacterium]|nr:putative hydrolase of the superfamily [Chloroflexota bacterium]
MRAVIFDVGGTLLREAPLIESDEAARVRLDRLRHAFHGDRAWFQGLVSFFSTDQRTDPTHRQDTRGQVRDYLAARGVTTTTDDLELVRSACCLPGPSMEAMHDGALDALRHARGRGLGIALCTNVFWRTGEDSRADWAARGAGELIDAHVTSIDVGWLKPHPAMFESALSALGVDAADAVMVGDSGAKDVGPAKRLGMRAIHVRSSDTSSADPPADAWIADITGVPEALDRLDL